MALQGQIRNYGRLLSFVQFWESEAELDSFKSKIKLANHMFINIVCARLAWICVQT